MKDTQQDCLQWGITKGTRHSSVHRHPIRGYGYLLFKLHRVACIRHIFPFATEMTNLEKIILCLKKKSQVYVSYISFFLSANKHLQVRLSSVMCMRFCETGGCLGPGLSCDSHPRGVGAPPLLSLLLIFIGVQVLYNAVSSAAQQSKSDTHIHMLLFSCSVMSDSL